MKEFTFYLKNKGLVDVFFPHNRIKTKLQIIEILFEACRHILYYEGEDDYKIDSNSSRIILIIKKMSRLFFITDNKYYSINFPFNIYIENDKARTISYKLTSIDSQIISDILSIIKDTRFNSSDILDFADSICDNEKNNSEIWNLMREMILTEDGYIRADSDKEGFVKAKDAGKPKTHPEHHFDVFYESNNTFKIGLTRKINSIDFIDHLNIESDCIFIQN